MIRSYRAARGTATLWRAHDEKKELLGELAAATVYETLAPWASPGQARVAGRLTIKAFFLSDEAERHQRKDGHFSFEENSYYEEARKLLARARQMCDLEIKSPGYTVKWWQEFRHRDFEAVEIAMTNEHITQLSAAGLDRENAVVYSSKCVPILIDAAKKHHDFELAKNLLTGYYTLYFEALEKQVDIRGE